MAAVLHNTRITSRFHANGLGRTPVTLVRLAKASDQHFFFALTRRGSSRGLLCPLPWGGTAQPGSARQGRKMNPGTRVVNDPRPGGHPLLTLVGDFIAESEGHELRGEIEVQREGTLDLGPSAAQEGAIPPRRASVVDGR